ncbi:MAG: FtsX-like permease family protein, partial [Candidatus Latescibacteria bacterium]|nr:FtsX-like permease family protein [Candidatus Latescibacterota bacterium]
GAPKTGVRGVWLRKGLVVAQFALSIALIAGTAIVYQQMAFIRSQRALSAEYVILTTDFFQMDSRSTANPDAWLVNRYWTIKDEILKHPNISAATASIWPKGSGGGMSQSIKVEGHEDEIVQVNRFNVDEDFIPFYDIEIVAGRNFSRDIPTDETQAYILNESAVKISGLSDPIGKTITCNNQPGQVIGVVKDYHFGTLHHKINPQVLVMGKTDFNFFTLKIHPENLSETIAFVKKTLSQFSPKPLPTTYWFEDDLFHRYYQQDIRTSTLVTTFSGLAIFLACLGLLGLAAYAAEQRTKEIGVRKVLGASVSEIMALLSKDFLKLVLIANIVAWPVAYLAANHWLQAFAYRIEVGVLPFFLGATLALLIALTTVSYQAWKATRANPVEALRRE